MGYSLRADAAPSRPLGSHRDLLHWLQWAPAANLVNHIAVAGNLWLAKALTSDAEAIGLYAACYMLAATLLPTSAILSSTCFRRFAGLVPSEPAVAAALLKSVLRGACLLAVLAVAGIWSCGETVLQIVFGDAYAGAAHLLLLLWLGMSATALYWFFCEMLAAAQALVVRLRAAAWSGACSALLAIVMLQHGGLPGSAAALLLGSSLGVAMTGLALHRIVGPFLPAGTLVRATLSAAAALAALLFARSLGMPQDRWFSAGFLVTGYAACLWLLGEFPRSKRICAAWGLSGRCAIRD
jgi:O-antigen/teichoic acid export membrane protein